MLDNFAIYCLIVFDDFVVEFLVIFGSVATNHLLSWESKGPGPPNATYPGHRLRSLFNTPAVPFIIPVIQLMLQKSGEKTTLGWS